MEAGARRAGLAGRTPKGLALCHLAKAEEKEVLLAAANKLAQCSVKLAPLRLVLLLGQLAPPQLLLSPRAFVFSGAGFVQQMPADYWSRLVDWIDTGVAARA